MKVKHINIKSVSLLLILWAFLAANSVIGKPAVNEPKSKSEISVKTPKNSNKKNSKSIGKKTIKTDDDKIKNKNKKDKSNKIIDKNKSKSKDITKLPESTTGVKKSSKSKKSKLVKKETKIVKSKSKPVIATKTANEKPIVKGKVSNKKMNGQGIKTGSIKKNDSKDKKNTNQEITEKKNIQNKSQNSVKNSNDKYKTTKEPTIGNINNSNLGTNKDTLKKQNIELKEQEKHIKAPVKNVPVIDKSGKKQVQKKVTKINNSITDTLSSIDETETDTLEKVTKKPKKGKNKSTFEVILNDTLSGGVYYKKVKIGNGKEKILIYIVEADLKNPNVGVALFKGKENSSELEKLHDMVKRYNENNDENVLASVNGSFWKAFYNYPMGPTVIDGEVVELRAYKSWHSAFIDENNKVYIDNFKLTSSININGKKYPVDMVNRRTDSTGISLYNKYVGDSVPYISRKMVSRAFENALLDSAFRDITDKEFDTASFKNRLLQFEKDSSLELNMMKITIQYIDKPVINSDIKCIVTGVSDTGLAYVPQDGFVLTIGNNIPNLKVREGDVLTLKYSTDKHSKIHFKLAVCGTPRLVQSGKSLYEGPQKRNRSRFKWEDLPRTGIGTNKAGDKLFLVAASPTYKSIGVKGCTIENFAFAMKKLKIFDGINLDGGGSSVMLINGKNVLSCPDCSRRLSIGVGITVKNNLSDK